MKKVVLAAIVASVVSMPTFASASVGKVSPSTNLIKTVASVEDQVAPLQVWGSSTTKKCSGRACIIIRF